MVNEVQINPYTTSWSWIIWLVLANIAFGLFAYTLLNYRKRFSVFTKLVLFTLAIIMPLAAVSLPVGASTDFYRYVWQGRVSNAGADNYKLKPWDAGTEKFNVELFERMDWKDKQSVYPPVAERFFQLNAKIFDAKLFSKLSFTSRLSLARLPNLSIFSLCGFIIYKLTKSKKYFLLWFTNPYLLFELVAMAHIDLLAITLLVLAALLIKRNKLTSRYAYTPLAGSLLSLAGLTKLTPFIFTLPIAAHLYVKFGLKQCALFLLGLTLTVLPFLNTFTTDNFAYIKRLSVWSSGSEIHFANPLYNLLNPINPSSAGIILKLVFVVSFAIVCIKIVQAVQSKTYAHRQVLKDCSLLSILPLLASPAILQWYWILPILLTLYATDRSHKFKAKFFIILSTLLTLQYVAGLEAVNEYLGTLASSIATAMLISTTLVLLIRRNTATTQRPR
jgi:hypothetical protein